MRHSSLVQYQRDFPRNKLLATLAGSSTATMRQCRPSSTRPKPMPSTSMWLWHSR